jgi:hypothetical protein
MSPLTPQRAPWIMLIFFCAAALILFIVSAGRDLGSIAGGESAAPIAHREPYAGEGGTPVRPAQGQGSPAVGHQSGTAERANPIRAAADAGVLLTHHYKPADTQFEAVFRTSRPQPESRVFFMPSPAIWVLDLPGAWKNASPREVFMDHGPIARVVVGEHESYLRIVFHYRNKDLPRPAEPPAVTRDPDGFSVIISH